MSTENLARRRWLAFAMSQGVGPRLAVRARRHFPELGQWASIGLEDMAAVLGFAPKRLRAGFEKSLVRADREIRIAESEGHRILTPWDFPGSLRELDDGPAALFVAGEGVIPPGTAVAIVGARRCTADGLRLARELGAALGERGIPVVSGLAKGIDGAAHEGMLGVDGVGVAVVAHGLQMIYPAMHRGLARRLQKRGLVATEMTWGTTPERGLFPRRNRIIAGLSTITVVVEASLKSGALITARFALEQGRTVLAVPGSPFVPTQRGCNDLIRSGAGVVESVDDILLALSLEDPQAREPAAGARVQDPLHQRLLEILVQAKSIGEICALSGLSERESMATLSVMEIEGLVERVGALYRGRRR